MQWFVQRRDNLFAQSATNISALADRISQAPSDTAQPSHFDKSFSAAQCYSGLLPQSNQKYDASVTKRDKVMLQPNHQTQSNTTPHIVPVRKSWHVNYSQRIFLMDRARTWRRLQTQKILQVVSAYLVSYAQPRASDPHDSDFQWHFSSASHKLTGPAFYTMAGEIHQHAVSDAS